MFNVFCMMYVVVIFILLPASFCGYCCIFILAVTVAQIHVQLDSVHFLGLTWYAEWYANLPQCVLKNIPCYKQKIIYNFLSSENDTFCQHRRNEGKKTKNKHKTIVKCRCIRTTFVRYREDTKSWFACPWFLTKC